MAHHHEQQSDKTPAELAARAWKLMEKIRFCMLCTWDGSRQQLRPLSAIPDETGGVVRFLVSAESSKTWQVERYPEVSLAFADSGGSTYVAVSGRATIGNDRAVIEELWNPFAKAYWDSADDPDIRVLTVVAEEAEIWDGPNVVVAAAVMLTSALTGGKPALGEHGSVRM